MKKIIILLILIYTSVSFISCRNKNAESKQKAQHVVLSLVTQDVPNSPPYKGYMAFAKKLEQLSEGTMSVEFIQATKFGTIADMLNTVVDKQFDIVAAPYYAMSEIIPEVELTGVPYIIRDYNHFLAILESNYGKKMEAEFHNIGIVPSSFWDVGRRQTTSNTPINSLKDFKGLKFRTSTSKNIIAFAECLGTSPVTVNFTELYQALTLDKIEAQENPIPVVDSKKLNEVQKYIAMTDHILTVVCIFINKEVYDSLSDEQRAWYHEALEHGRKTSTDLVFRNEELLLEKFEKEYGMIITYPNKQELQAAMQPYYDKLEKEFGEGSVSNLLSLQ